MAIPLNLVLNEHCIGLSGSCISPLIQNLGSICFMASLDGIYPIAHAISRGLSMAPRDVECLEGLYGSWNEANWPMKALRASSISMGHAHTCLWHEDGVWYEVVSWVYFPCLLKTLRWQVYRAPSYSLTSASSHPGYVDSINWYIERNAGVYIWCDGYTDKYMDHYIQRGTSILFYSVQCHGKHL